MGSGCDALPTGTSYSTLPPSSMTNPRSSLGVPGGNTDHNLNAAVAGDLDKFVVPRHALQRNGQPGGAPDLTIPGAFGPPEGITVLSDTALRLR